MKSKMLFVNRVAHLVLSLLIVMVFGELLLHSLITGKDLLLSGSFFALVVVGETTMQFSWSGRRLRTVFGMVLLCTLSLGAFQIGTFVPYMLAIPLAFIGIAVATSRLSRDTGMIWKERPGMQAIPLPATFVAIMSCGTLLGLVISAMNAL